MEGTEMGDELPNEIILKLNGGGTLLINIGGIYNISILNSSSRKSGQYEKPKLRKLE